MKYYPEYDFDYKNIKSVEYDVKSVVWLSKLKLGG